MSRKKSHFSCSQCGYESAKWLGKCPSCQEWSTFVEEQEETGLVSDVRQQFSTDARWEDLDQAETDRPQERLKTGLSELDRTLGGGLVRDSFVLLGGDPGIGKSTLLLQMVAGLLAQNPGLRILYVSGEESLEQIRLRARRLGVVGGGRVYLASETRLEHVFDTIKELEPHIVFMDSLQTFATSQNTSAPGSVTQVRDITARLMTLAKSAHISIWLVGHVTKDGTIAGPKTIEHMVDTVLSFESETGQSYRLLRSVKNRFGSTRELGVFEMHTDGLHEVANPSALFLSERTEAVSGTAVGALLEGSRPLLVELQALVIRSGFSVPRRTSVGMDSTRITLLAAILEKHLKLALGQEDLFFNVAGGFRLSEPACDLAAAAAIWSSAYERPLPPTWIFIGELGLTGEVRRVSQIEMRIDEAKRLGFEVAIVPENTPQSITCMELRRIARIEELQGLLR